MISICVFGSHARQTSDHLSDRDVLVVGDDSQEVFLIAQVWQATGWNVTTFTNDALMRMAEAKALFVQHLKQEGKIIRDDGGRLSAIISNYQPKISYDRELLAASRHLVELGSETGIYWRDLCLADANYVFFRNLLILYFASRQKYIFEYDRLLSLIGKTLPLEGRRLGAITGLRSLKCAYRKRLHQPSLLANFPLAQETVFALCNRLDLHVCASESLKKPEDWYLRVRKLELDLLNNNNPKQLDALLPGQPLYDEWHYIRNSGGYPKPRRAIDEVSNLNFLTHRSEIQPALPWGSI